MQRDDSIHERLADRLANILTKLNMGYQLSIKELASEFGVSTALLHKPICKGFFSDIIFK